ncbi:hypothetical protein V1517DRAFT_129876 [Lipomyces orientalis]|uniref:Uncharacterized protein n=1 Tax=Lipomyces orientalis TaxID=1233043 RepID=A0ACC3TPS4_9ASCO
MAASNSKYSSHSHNPLTPAADQPEYNTRKRVGKACDSCRIKKSKCDGRKPCSRCIMDDKICTFTERKKSKEKLYSSRYVELLENRIEILQNGMAELVRRVSRGDDVSCLLSKSGHVSINRALDELTSRAIELQKEERERFAVVREHDESEHDTEHEHDHDDNDSVAASDIKMEDRSVESLDEQQQTAQPELVVDTGVAQDCSSVSQTWARVPFLSGSTAVGAYDSETSAMPADFISRCAFPPDPATIIRGHNHPESMSPSSMTSASSLYSSSSGSPSPIDIQFVTLDNTMSPAKSLPAVYETFNGPPTNPMEINPMMGKVDDLSDLWLTSTFMEI